MKHRISWLGQTVFVGIAVLRKEDGHALRRALHFELKSQRKNGQSKEEWEVKGRIGGQRKNGRSKESRLMMKMRRKHALC